MDLRSDYATLEGVSEGDLLAITANTYLAESTIVVDFELFNGDTLISSGLRENANTLGHDRLLSTQARALTEMAHSTSGKRTSGSGSYCVAVYVGKQGTYEIDGAIFSVSDSDTGIMRWPEARIHAAREASCLLKSAPMPKGKFLALAYIGRSLDWIERSGW